VALWYISDVTSHSIAEYCQQHQIGFTLALFILGIPFSIYAPEIKAFLRIPPQRIGVWILKARLSNSEHRLWQLVRMQENVRFAVYLMYSSCTVLGMAILCATFYCAVTLYQILQVERSAHWKYAMCFYLLVPIVYYAIYRTTTSVKLAWGAARGRQAIEELESHIENLSKRLQSN
jgi:hypothetical protein